MMSEGRGAGRAIGALAIMAMFAACGAESGPSGDATMAGDWSYSISNATAGGGETCDVTGLSLLIIPGNDAPGDFAGSVFTTSENNIVCVDEGGTQTMDIDGSSLMLGVLQTGTSVKFSLPNPFQGGLNWPNTGTISGDGNTMSGAVTMYLDGNDALEGSWTATRK